MVTRNLLGFKTFRRNFSYLKDVRIDMFELMDALLMKNGVLTVMTVSIPNNLYIAPISDWTVASDNNIKLLIVNR